MTDAPIPIRSGVVPLGVPDPDIVTWLEVLLEDAKRGDIRAIGVVALKEADVMKCWCRANPPLGNALLGAVQRLSDRITRALEDGQ